MKRKIISTLISMVALMPLLTGCKNDAPVEEDVINRWGYTIEEFADFKEVYGKTKTIEQQKSLSYSSNDKVFNKTLTSDDVRVYNYSKLDDDITFGSINMEKGYIPYSTLSNYFVDVSNIEANEYGVNVSFKGTSENDYRVLVNKDSVLTAQYLDIDGIEGSLDQQIDIETETEEAYVSAGFDWEDGKKVISLIGGITQLIVGTATGVPTAQAGGIFTIITSLGDLFACKSEPTIADVLNKLNEMDKKLDDIQTQINKNHQELIDLNLLIELGITQELMVSYENGISQFKADYAAPIQEKLIELRYDLENRFKTLVGAPREFNLYFSKVDGRWTLASVTDTNYSGKTHVNFVVNTWTNANAYLSSHGNAVGSGYLDEVQQDILAAVQNVEAPEGMSKLDLATNALQRLSDEFGKARYEGNITEAAQLAAKAEMFANEIVSGNVVKYYFERLKMIYNFVGETKDRVLDAYVGLDRQLDLFCGHAVEALRYTEQNTENLKNAWLTARKYIAANYNAMKDLKPNYCYTTSCYLKSDFYRIKYDLSYTDPGNHCVFHSKVNFARVDKGYTDIKYTALDINSINVLESINYKRIVNKFHLMQANGIYGTTTAFVSYLRQVEVLSVETASSFEYLLNKGAIDLTNEKFASEITSRKMTDSDKNVNMTCVAAGNPDGEYFSVGWNGKFRSHEDSSCWNGTTLETTFFDGETGNVTGEKRVVSYATYAESHALWIDDEFWAFTDYPQGQYFYMLTIA